MEHGTVTNGTVTVRSWCGPGAVVVRSRYGCGSVQVQSWFGNSAVSRYYIPRVYLRLSTVWCGVVLFGVVHSMYM